MVWAGSRTLDTATESGDLHGAILFPQFVAPLRQKTFSATNALPIQRLAPVIIYSKTFCVSLSVSITRMDNYSKLLPTI